MSEALLKELCSVLRIQPEPTVENTMVINGTWTTPYTGVKNKTVGAARLRLHHYKRRECYPMEGMRGFEYWVSPYRQPVMNLQRRDASGKWRTWMVDDPPHWYGMEELVRRIPPGRVLCAGLGLGLMVHHLVDREDIEDITVIELSPDVIRLIKPHLPQSGRVQIIHDDFYKFLARGRGVQYDSILWDLAVGGPAETVQDFVDGFALSKLYAPHAPLFQFGLRDGANHLFDEQAAPPARKIEGEDHPHEQSDIGRRESGDARTTD